MGRLCRGPAPGTDCPTRAVLSVGERCATCRPVWQAAKDARRPDRRSWAETFRRRQLVNEHVATWGLLCPGIGAEHPSHPVTSRWDLTADHVTPVAAGGAESGPLRVVCRAWNSSRGART